nr:hypothetical protein [Tanacetum cinerariifolium]
PLLPSEQNGPPLPRRPKSRDVTSRYLSNSTSSVSSTLTSSSNTTSSSSSFNSVCTPRRRFPSPSQVVTPVRKGALSAERRRPGTPVVSAAAKMLMTATPSARSLSVSFQGESFKMPVKAKPAPNGSRCGTPDKRAVTPVRKVGNVIATPKTIDQQRWPARARQGGFMTRSVDFSNENVKLSGSIRDLQKSRKVTSTRPDVLEVRRSVEKVVSDCDNNSDRTVSDAESVSSGSIRGITPRAILVPPRFRQEPVNRLRKVQPEPVSPPLSRNSKLLLGNRYLRDGPTLSPRGNSPSPVRGAVRPASPARGAVRPASPVRGAVRPASPVKGAVRPASPNKSVPYSSALSPSRGMASPTRVRSGVGVTSNLGNAPSILNFAAETRRRKVGDNAVADAHLLRMLHNKYLQWRFANARADAAMLVQRSAAE